MFLPVYRSTEYATRASQLGGSGPAPGHLARVHKIQPALLLLVTSISLAGCQPHMVDQPRVDTMQPSVVFHDGRGQRPPLPGTIARGALSSNDVEQTGISGGKPVERTPVPVTESLLSRGQQRYKIYCTPCHGPTGYGDGMVVQRGFPSPPSYHIDRLVNAADGELFKVITHGRGRMPPFGKRINSQDRWAIVAYIRALQLSQSADLTDLPESDQHQFRK